MERGNKKVVLSKKKAILMFTSACLLPVIFLWCAYCLEEMIPFGDNLVYTWDLSGQYSAFYLWLHRALVGEVSSSYILTGGFGSNTAGLFAYYLSSPFNLVLVFFSEKTMPYGVALLISLKTAMMGGFMNLYLYHKSKHAVSLAFSTMYALSSYAIAYQSNIMWMDAIIWLPFVIWGIEKIVEQQKYVLYIVALAITVISNYFTGYEICLFSAIYFILYLLFFQKINRIRTFIRYALSSILAIGISACVLIPAILQLGSSANRGHAGFDVLWNTKKIFMYHHMLLALMAGTFQRVQRIGINDSLPLLYCGILTVFGIVLFLFARKISLRIKIFYVAILGIMIASLNHMNLFYLWHGMYSPRGAPWRYAFIWSFIAVSVSYLGITVGLYKESKGKNKQDQGERDFAKIDIRIIIIAIGCMIAYFGIIYWKYDTYRTSVKYNIIFVTLEIASFIIITYIKCKRINNIKKLEGKSTKKKLYYGGLIIAYTVLIVIVGHEEIYNMRQIWSEDYNWDSNSEYQKYLSDMNDLRNDANETISMYREQTLGTAEKIPNEGFLLGLNSINIYTSTEKESNWNIMYTLGLGMNNSYCFYDKGSTQLVDDLVGLKYIYAENEAASLHSNYRKVKEVDDLAKYENEDALPLAFLVNDSATSIEMEEREVGDADLFDVQNKLYQALLGADNEEVLYSKLDTDEASAILAESQIEAEEGKITWIRENYYTDGISVYQEDQEKLSNAVAVCQEKTESIDASNASKIKATVVNDTGENAYVCITVPYEKSFQAKVNGKKVICTKGMGGFLLVPVTQGEQNIVITYHVPGIKISMLISILSIICVVLLWKKDNRGTI